MSTTTESNTSSEAVNQVTDATTTTSTTTKTLGKRTAQSALSCDEVQARADGPKRLKEFYEALSKEVPEDSLAYLRGLFANESILNTEVRGHLDPEAVAKDITTILDHLLNLSSYLKLRKSDHLSASQDLIDQIDVLREQGASALQDILSESMVEVEIDHTLLKLGDRLKQLTASKHMAEQRTDNIADMIWKAAQRRWIELHHGVALLLKDIDEMALL